MALTIPNRKSQPGLCIRSKQFLRHCSVRSIFVDRFLFMPGSFCYPAGRGGTAIRRNMARETAVNRVSAEGIRSTTELGMVRNSVRYADGFVHAAPFTNSTPLGR